jgi:hypothetical protein
MMRVRGYDISKAQLGWQAECFFMVYTSQQFTAEERMATGYSRWLLLALLNSYLEARRFHRELKAKPGEREAQGWA